MNLQYVLLTFENNGHTLLMGCGADIKIKELNGIESAEYINHTSSNACEDGEKVTGKKVGKRTIDILFGVDATPDDTVLIRRRLVKFFNPKYPTTLTINYCYSQGRIQCEIESFNFEEQATLWDTLIGGLTLICPDPYWQALDDFGKNIASTNAQFAWPLAFAKTIGEHNEIGKIFSYKEFSKQVVLSNDGDVETGIVIQFLAKKGEVKNPKIIKVSTGEFIEVFCDMKKDDVVEINTNKNKKSVTHNGNRISKDINKLSTYFQLDVGDNIISYEAQENDTNLEVRLYYTPKSLGI